MNTVINILLLACLGFYVYDHRDTVMKLWAWVKSKISSAPATDLDDGPPDDKDIAG